MKYSLILIAALLLCTAAAPAQEYTEEVAVNYVMVPFTVLGGRGIPITDLKAKEVQVFVDGQQIATDMFEMSMNAPVSWTILLDGSGSMALAGKLPAAKAVINALTARRRKDDDFALYVFDSEGHAHDLVPWTENPAAISRALDTIKPWGRTAFFDALSEMPARSELGRNPTRAIILLSDGIDNASKLTRAEIEKRLEGVSIPIYAFGLREPGAPELAAKRKREKKVVAPVAEETWNLDLLAELAAATGGKLIIGNRPELLASAMDAIDKDLRAQYLIGFTPTGKGAVKYRRISLKLAGRVRSVRVRAGYRGTEPPVLSAASRGKPKRNERKRST